MITDWITFSNPVAVWWGFLLVVSTVNIALFVFLHSRLRAQALLQFGIVRVELLAFLGAAYVFGCAFRSILPRADVQRICLFDTWLSSVAVGRTVATLAEAGSRSRASPGSKGSNASVCLARPTASRPCRPGEAADRAPRRAAVRGVE